MDSALNPLERFVLLVEDNADDAELTMRAFKTNHVVNPIVHVWDGVEALDFLWARGKHSGRDSAHLPSVVLLDISMPRLSGLDVLAEIRGHPLTGELPVVILTSSDEQIDIARAYGGGANSYVRKPVEFGEFIAAVGKLGVYWMLVNLTSAPRIPLKEGL